MRLLVRGTLGVLFLLGTARIGYAAGCDPHGTDMAAVDAARAQVSSQCMCDHTDSPTTNHGQYVSCAAGVAEEMPWAYKDVADVVEVVDRAGLARRVVKLKPLVVVKG